MSIFAYRIYHQTYLSDRSESRSCRKILLGAILPIIRPILMMTLFRHHPQVHHQASRRSHPNVNHLHLPRHQQNATKTTVTHTTQSPARQKVMLPFSITNWAKRQRSTSVHSLTVKRINVVKITQHSRLSKNISQMSTTYRRKNCRSQRNQRLTIGVECKMPIVVSV